MKVSEIFHSVQGEGISAGRPSIFLRLGFCDLHCYWCDTKYTWLFTDQMLDHVKADIEKLKAPLPNDLKVYTQDFELKEMPISKVWEEVAKYKCNRLVITGGEPLLQQKELLLFLANNPLPFKPIVEIETNGTIVPDYDIRKFVTQWNVSIKLATSGNEREIRIKPDPIMFFAEQDNAWFKFVITSQEDMVEVLKLVEDFIIRPDRVILMPEATSPQELKSKSEWLVDVCKKFNFIFGNRIQVQVWGKERGV